MASTLGNESVSLEAPPKHKRHSAPRHAAVRRRSTLTVVAWVTAPRLAMAFVLSAVTERTAAVGTAGPAVHGVASGLLNWDGAHYLSIAEHGYVTVFDTIFFPLQPLLARPLAALLGFPNAVIAVSWIAFGFAVWGIVDVATRLTTRRGAIAAALLFAWNPVSVFLVTGYAESLFVALTVWSLRFCLERRWVWAAVLAGAASAVEPQGACAGVVVVVGILLAERGTRRLALAVGCGLIAEAGLIGFSLFCWDRFGKPLEFQTVASDFYGQHLTYPLHAFVEDLRFSGLRGGTSQLFTTSHFIYFVDAASSLVAVGALVLGIRQCLSDRRWILPMAFLVLAAWVSLSTVDAWAASDARFVFTLVTIYLLSAVVFEALARRSMALVAAVLVPCAALAIYLEALFHMVYWVV